MSRIADSHIVIAPSKHQVIVNPQSGKRERVFVNLDAVYPTPEEPGTELSFEELWAANQGWLDVSWEDDSFADELQEPTLGQGSEVDMLSNQVAEKLVVHQDVVELDENGAIKESSRPAKSKKKKVMEYNETQISQFIPPHLPKNLSLLYSINQITISLILSQSKQNWTHLLGQKLRRRRTTLQIPSLP